MFFCSLCNSFGGQSFNSVLRHIGEVHKHDPGFQIQCGLAQCPETYKNYESFRSHVYRKHRSVLFIQQDETSSSNSTSSNSNDPESHSHVDYGVDSNEDSYEDNPFDHTHSSSSPRPPDPDSSKDEAKVVAAKFIMKIREEYRIPQSTVTGLIKDVDSLYSSAIEKAKDTLLAKLTEHHEHAENSEENHGLENQSDRGIRQLILESLDGITSPFIDLNTQYKQTSYLKQYLEPHERVLGRYMEDKNGQCKLKTDCCYDVDLLESLSSLLKMTSIQDQVMNSHQLSNGLLMDYCDGALFKENRLFIEDPCALQIRLYFDEIEVCNPIGSFAKKHKLGCLYYTLGNLHPKLRSSLKGIHLLCIVKHSYDTELTSF